MIDLKKERETVHNAINTLFDIAKVQKAEIDSLKSTNFSLEEINSDLNESVKLLKAESDSLKEKLVKVEGDWVSVGERLPEFGEVVLVFCANANYKHDGLKQTVATYSSAQEIFDCSEFYHDISECKDSFVVEVSLFDDEYGGRYFNEDVTHWMPLPSSPVIEAQEDGG